jgi:hypothetical protein
MGEAVQQICEDIIIEHVTAVHQAMGVFLYARVFFFLILILLARVFVKIQLH